jgi:hypothetical protein
VIKKKQMFIPVENVKVALACAKCQTLVVVMADNITSGLQSCSVCGDAFFRKMTTTALDGLRQFLDHAAERKTEDLAKPAHQFYFVVDGE